MPRPRQEPLEIDRRRQQVAELYLQGRYQWEIAEVVGVDHSTVSRDLKAIQERWKASAVRDLDAAKARELERTDQLERTYWQAWERSQKDAESTTTRTEEAGEAPKEGESGPAPSDPPKLVPVKRTTEKSAKGQAGDPRFLDGVLSCIKRRCDLLGLDAPKQTQLTGADGKSFVLTVLGPGQKMEDL